MLEGKNTICCFKNTMKNGGLFYGGSFVLSDIYDAFLLNPGEDICFKTKLVGPGMPYDGAISFFNEQAVEYSKISCYLENILYTVDKNGTKYDKLTIESNAVNIVDLKMIDDDFMNITLNYNGKTYRYPLFFMSKTFPDKAEDFQSLYSKILNRRGFSSVTFKPGYNDKLFGYSSGEVKISPDFFNHRLSDNDLAEIYKYCLMSCKYREGRNPYVIKENGQIQTGSNSRYPKAYIVDLVASLGEVLNCEGLFYTLSNEQREAYRSDMDYWKQQLDNGSYY